GAGQGFRLRIGRFLAVQPRRGPPVDVGVVIPDEPEQVLPGAGQVLPKLAPTPSLLEVGHPRSTSALSCCRRIFTIAVGLDDEMSQQYGSLAISKAAWSSHAPCRRRRTSATSWRVSRAGSLALSDSVASSRNSRSKSIRPSSVSGFGASPT